jgi:hypothetical protein
VILLFGIQRLFGFTHSIQKNVIKKIVLAVIHKKAFVCLGFTFFFVFPPLSKLNTIIALKRVHKRNERAIESAQLEC